MVRRKALLAAGLLTVVGLAGCTQLPEPPGGTGPGAGDGKVVDGFLVAQDPDAGGYRLGGFLRIESRGALTEPVHYDDIEVMLTGPTGRVVHGFSTRNRLEEPPRFVRASPDEPGVADVAYPERFAGVAASERYWDPELQRGVDPGSGAELAGRSDKLWVPCPGEGAHTLRIVLAGEVAHEGSHDCAFTRGWYTAEEAKRIAGPITRTHQAQLTLPNASEPSFQVSLDDIDGDGKPEWIVLEALAGTHRVGGGNFLTHTTGLDTDAEHGACERQTFRVDRDGEPSVQDATPEGFCQRPLEGGNYEWAPRPGEVWNLFFIPCRGARDHMLTLDVATQAEDGPSTVHRVAEDLPVPCGERVLEGGSFSPRADAAWKRTVQGVAAPAQDAA